MNNVIHKLLRFHICSVIFKYYEKSTENTNERSCILSIVFNEFGGKLRLKQR